MQLLEFRELGNEKINSIHVQRVALMLNERARCRTVSRVID